MYTKPLTYPSIAAVDISADISAIRRLLVAAAISPRFCESLLGNPGDAVRHGFAGERFQLSESTLTLLSSIRASSLPEFTFLLDKNLSNHLLTSAYT